MTINNQKSRLINLLKRLARFEHRSSHFFVVTRYEIQALINKIECKGYALECKIEDAEFTVNHIIRNYR